MLAVALSVIVILTVLKPIAATSGYDTARGASIGLGIGGVILFFVFRYIAGKANGCLFRMIVKLIGFLAYALGIGLLFVTFLLNEQFKGLMGIKDTPSNAASEEANQQ